jgi:tetratricopeptide (TPR) repeat protein
MKGFEIMTRIVAALFLICFVGCETRETQLQRFLLQGNQALKEQNHQGAEYYFNEALKIEPCFADALNNLGVLNSDQKHFDRAIDYFDGAIACDADFLPPYFNRANAFYESKEYFRLLSDADYILKIKPDTAVGLVLKGLALTKLRQFDAALSAFSQVVEREPSNAEHYVNRGTVKYYQKNWHGATNDFKKALQLHPSQANALNALGLISVDKQQLDSAKGYFNAALTLVPQEPYFLNNLGLVYLLEKNLDSAKATINLSITLDPDNAWAYRNKGIYYLDISDYPSAERLLKQSLDMDGTVEKAHYYYGLALLKTGKRAEACQQFLESEKAGDGLVKNEIARACR